METIDNHTKIAKSLSFIKPNAEWKLSDEELEWLDETQTKPTEAEIEAGWVAYQSAQETEIQAKAQSKSAAQAKLAALGLTIDDLRALGL
jgi:hypothetical protein